MEVGAVKQAFNNEVIQLKKNLNQARLQVIHKLTRKAKTLVEKKTVDHLKEKNRRKAESAVKEVLIMKKLKPRDIARFIITYKGELISHLNKPAVDSDKACARLLLHKSLQQKYKLIKDKFGDIPIKDLLMSRQERLKLKKEARDEQKNKKKGKNKVVNAEGAWNVEDVVMGDDSQDINDELQSDDKSQDDDKDNGDASDISNDVSDDEDDDTPVTRQVVNDSDESNDGEQFAEVNAQESDCGGDSHNEDIEENEENSEVESQSSSSDEEIDTEVKLKPSEKTKPLKTSNLKPNPVKPVTVDIDNVLAKLKPKKKPDKKVKDNKNKNLNEKMMNRKFKKEIDDNLHTAKVVDPFFKTATGGNYMSIAEPRQPDEIKEVHRQGNRQERRAAMFGRAPIRPRRNDRQNFRSDNFNNRNSKFNKDGNDGRAKFNDKNNFNNRDSNFNGRNPKFNDRNLNNNEVTPKDEKLHPSWEAKKKQSGILPFKGKKTVFDES